MERNLSLGKADRQVTTISGEMYPDCGMPQRLRLTSCLADKSSFCIPGNGMQKRPNDRRHGAHPLKNESRRTSGISKSKSLCTTEMFRSVSSGKGVCIAAAIL